MPDKDTPSNPVSNSVEIAGLRADMYRLLAIGFAEPTRELVRGLIDSGFQNDILEAASDLAIPASLSIPPFEELVKNAGRKDPEAFYHELNSEYTRLFIGPGPAVVPPYESMHVDVEPGIPALLMVSPAAEAVLESYRHAGLSLTKDLNEPPDHIATELEFMYYLCQKEMIARGQGIKAEADKWRHLQQAFTLEHLGRWGEDLCVQVEKAANEKFYAALSLAAGSFLRYEKATL